jgi:hypothetical protein
MSPLLWTALWGLGMGVQTGAGDSLEAAKRYFEAGSQAYRQSRYDAAIAAFEAAYDLAPRPALAFSMGQAYRLQYFLDRDPGKLVRAVELYKRYLAEDPDGRRREDAVDHLSTLEPIVLRMEQERRLSELEAESARRTQLMVATGVEGARAAIDGGPPETAPLVAEVGPGEHEVRVEASGYASRTVRIRAVEGRLVVVDGNLQALPGQLRITGARGAQVSVGGRPVGKTPLDGPISLEAGRHFVTVEKRGAVPVARDVRLERGGEQTVRVDLHPTRQRRWAWGVLGLSTALAAAGGVSLGVTLSAESDAQGLTDRLQSSGLTAAEARELDDAIARRDDFRVASAVLLGTAGVAAATGLLLFLFDRPPVPSAPAQPGPETPDAPSGPRMELGLGPTTATWTARF